MRIELVMDDVSANFGSLDPDDWRYVPMWFQGKVSPKVTVQTPESRPSAFVRARVGTPNEDGPDMLAVRGTFTRLFWRDEGDHALVQNRINGKVFRVDAEGRSVLKRLLTGDGLEEMTQDLDLDHASIEGFLDQCETEGLFALYAR